MAFAASQAEALERLFGEPSPLPYTYTVTLSPKPQPQCPPPLNLRIRSPKPKTLGLQLHDAGASESRRFGSSDRELSVQSWNSGAQVVSDCPEVANSSQFQAMHETTVHPVKAKTFLSEI